ncbi:MAG: GIN domain-containing protein [Flavobacteriales bacterium]
MIRSVTKYGLIFMLACSCNQPYAPDCFQRAGDYETELRTVGNFNTIELRDYVQIELYDSTETFVEVTAPRNLIPDIKTEVQNEVLKIENKNTCNFVRSYKNNITVRIYAPSFADIQHHGTGDIKSVNTITSTYFKIENHKSAGTMTVHLNVDSVAILTHRGMADVICTGTSTKTTLFSQGLGYIDCSSLISTDTYVNNSSINDVYANCNGYMYCYIAFSGNIYYTGTPNYIDVQNEGSGSVVEKP